MMQRRYAIHALLLGVLTCYTAVNQLHGQVDITLARLLSTEDRVTWAESVEYLLSQPVSSFGATEQASLRTLLGRKALADFPELILVAGAVGGSALLGAVPPALRAEPEVSQLVKLARVRAGDEALAAELVDRLRDFNLDDDYVERLLPDLLYTRSRTVLDHLWQLTVVPNAACTTLDPEDETYIDCGYRLAEGLGRVTVGFPVPLGAEGLFAVPASDYAAALERVRRWYRGHADSYVIDQTGIR